MGNTLQAEIRLDHETGGRRQGAIVAGTPLRGRVIVHVKKGVDRCNSVTLEVSGKEMTAAYQYLEYDKSVHPYNRHGDDDDEDHHRKLIKDLNSFFRVDVKLQKSGEKVDAQTYVFPFEINLPASLPASCAFQQDNDQEDVDNKNNKDKANNEEEQQKQQQQKGGFAIEYYLKIKTGRVGANLANNRRTFLVESAPIVGTTRATATTSTNDLTMDQKKTAVPCLIPPKTFNVQKLGLVGKGNFMLGARVEDTRVGRGQTLWLTLVCRNHSTCDMDRIIIRLVEEYQWSAKKDSGGEEQRTLVTVEKDKKQLPVSAVEWKGKSHKSNEIETLNTKQGQENTNWEIYRDLISQDNKLALDIPWEARDSFTGVKVKVSHYVEIELRTLLSSSVHAPPSIRIPLRIGNAIMTTAIRPPPSMTTTSSSNSSATDETSGIHPPTKKSPRTSQLDLPKSVRRSLAIASKENMVLGRRAGMLDAQGSSFRMDSFRLRQSFQQDSARFEESFSSIPSTQDSSSFRSSSQHSGSSGAGGGGGSDHRGGDQDKNASPPTLPTLLEEMAVSVDDFDLLEQKLSQTKSEWPTLLKLLTPDEFGSVIAHVNMEFAQPRVGVLLARHIGDAFTCAHCVAAVKSTAKAFRSNMVEGLLPFCSDLTTEHEMIREQLSDFEQIIVAMWNVQDEEKEAVIDKKTTPQKAAKPDNEKNTGDINGNDDTAAGDAPKRRSTMATAPLIAPTLDDICMGLDDHKGTVDCADVVRWSVMEFANTEYSPAVYKKIKRKLKRRRFLTRPKRKSSANHPDHWRESTQRERIEYVGKLFDNEKWIQKRAEEQAAAVNNSNDGVARQEEDSNKIVVDEEWFTTIEEDRKAWEKDMKGTEWDRAVTVTSFDGDDLDMDSDDDDDEGGPSKIDVCFDVRDHPGNRAFENEVRAMLKKFANTTWGPPVYKALKKRLRGKRFFYGSRKGQWRELTQKERIDHFGTRFEAEKKKMKERQQREASREEAAQKFVPNPAATTANAKTQPSEQTSFDNVNEQKTPQPSLELPTTPQQQGDEDQKAVSNGSNGAGNKSSTNQEKVDVVDEPSSKKDPTSTKRPVRDKTPPPSEQNDTQAPSSPMVNTKRASTLHSPRRKEKRSMRHPQEFDVCFGDDDHPGTVSFVKTVKDSMAELLSEDWSDAIYKSYKKKLVGRRFFIRPDPTLPWREATEEERLERLKDRFDSEQLKGKIGKIFG